MKASYVSTGAGGPDYEVDATAALLVRLLTETEDRSFPAGHTVDRLSLQNRSGPTKFDDIGVACIGPSGRTMVYVQAKLSFALGKTAAFQDLVRAIYAHEQINRDEWSAVILAGEITPDIADVQALLASARTQPSSGAFEAVWGADRATNPAKRLFLSAVRAALSGENEDASWRTMRRLSVVEFDYHLDQSRDRQIAVDTLSQHVPANGPPNGQALFGALRELVLRNGKIAASWSRVELVAALGVNWGLLPGIRTRATIDRLERMSAVALDAIPTHLQGRAPYPAMSLIRAEIYSEAAHILAAERCVRITGEGGSGKSALLKRLALKFDGAVLALKDDRLAGTSWDSFATSNAIDLSAEQVVSEFAMRGPCLLAIDGADRILLSSRRGVVLDLLRAIVSSPLSNRWSIATSARDFQTRDLVASALADAGFESFGHRSTVGSVELDDINVLAKAFPAIIPVASRGDLGNRNRILFLLKEVLSSSAAGATFTEVGLAHAWATRGGAVSPAQPHRDTALAQFGELLLCRPQRKPGRGDLDPDGLQVLFEEGVIYGDPSRDTLSFTHDVHEDWILARTFDRHQSSLTKLLQAAEEPLWWLRAMRVLGQMILEANGSDDAWCTLLETLHIAKEIDPAWERSLLVAPLYSERAEEILTRLEPVMLNSDAWLLERLIDTLLVYETQLDEGLLRSDLLAEKSEIERLRVVASMGIPKLRSWLSFLQWSIPRWKQWPTRLVPKLSEIAARWCFITEGLPEALTQQLVQASSSWLEEIEDSHHADQSDATRDPFGLKAISYHDWEEIEKRIRRVLKMGVRAAPSVVEAYLKRLMANDRLASCRSDMIENPRLVPAALPTAFVDLAVAHFTPRRKRIRRDSGMLMGHHCFTSMGYHDAGISHGTGFFPSSPERGEFSSLFATDEVQALRLFHRLEIRASVYYRNHIKWNDGRRARALVVKTPWGSVPLWGDENVYRWARGILGSHVLGSAYLALDEWLGKQAANGRPLLDLCRLVLQPNGLVSTASPLINVIVEHINTPGQIDAAGMFLSVPRLWQYDIRRHVDESSRSWQIGFRSRDQHFEAVRRVNERYLARQFLQNDLLLAFQLKSGPDARQAFYDARAGWSPRDLVAYADENDHLERFQEYEARIERMRSDVNPNRIEFEYDESGSKLIVKIAPSEAAVEEIARFEERQTNLSKAMRLSNWVRRSRENGVLSPDLSLGEAIALADEVEQLPLVDDLSITFLMQQNRNAGIVGTAALLARHADETFFAEKFHWAEQRIIAGCLYNRGPEEQSILVDEAHLFDDPQIYGAEGLAAMINRGQGTREHRQLAIQIATDRLHEVVGAMVCSLDWKLQPEFAWQVTIAALDAAVVWIGRSWVPNEQPHAAKIRQRDKQNAVRRAGQGWLGSARGPMTPPPPYRTKLIFQRSWRKPIRSVRVRANRSLQWNLVVIILKMLPFDAIVSDQRKRRLMASYLSQLLDWTRAYSEDVGSDRYGAQFPYELGHGLARALGRFAAAGGSPSLWQALRSFKYHGRAADLIGDYVEAVTSELIESGRSPDSRFWGAWRPPANWIMDNCVPRHRASNGRHDWLGDAVTAAGFVGPYMTPIPPDWPHLDAILPTIDEWAAKVLSFASGAYFLLVFSERLGVSQRERWLLRWLADFVAVHGGDNGFWSFNFNGDRAAGLLKPLEVCRADTRREIRRILSIIADAGSLAAREILVSFATARDGL